MLTIDEFILITEPLSMIRTIVLEIQHVLGGICMYLFYLQLKAHNCSVKFIG